jgi:hypothetical protein
MNTLTPLAGKAVRVFMEKGDKGTIWLGNNPYYAENGAQNHRIDSWGCSAEDGAVVAWVVEA